MSDISGNESSTALIHEGWNHLTSQRPWPRGEAGSVYCGSIPIRRRPSRH